MKLMVNDFVNGTARATFNSRKGTYRVGAAIAKEGWKKGKRSMVWFMEKRSRGYDRSKGDWWYATVSSRGKVLNAGKVAMCSACHDGAANDYVFGLPR